MQGPNIFTVGGSISVNAHGWDKNTPAVADTVEWFRIALADGTIKRCSLQENFELFHLVLGGYGLFGVILDVGLRVTENHLLQPRYSILPYQALGTHLERQVFNNERAELVYADLEIAPETLFDEVIISHFERVNQREDLPVVPLQEEKYELRDRLFLNLSRKYQWGKSLRWVLYKALRLPNLLLTRNNLMRAPFQRLRYYSPEDVDILQEYFIPREYAIHFIDSVRTIVKRYNANLLNCTVRIVNRSSKTFLNYAKRDSFAFVLYLNVRKDESGKSMDRMMTRELIDTTLSYGGAFYLPYLPHYDREQLRSAYPEIDSFFAAKKNYDPDELFTNYFYDRYGLNRISLSP